MIDLAKSTLNASCIGRRAIRPDLFNESIRNLLGAAAPPTRMVALQPSPNVMSKPLRTPIFGVQPSTSRAAAVSKLVSGRSERTR